MRFWVDFGNGDYCHYDYFCDYRGEKVMRCDAIVGKNEDGTDKKCGGIMNKTLNPDGDEVWLCTLCGNQKIIQAKAKNWTTPQNLPEGYEKSVSGSKPFTPKEIARGYRKG